MAVAQPVAQGRIGEPVVRTRHTNIAVESVWNQCPARSISSQSPELAEHDHTDGLSPRHYRFDESGQTSSHQHRDAAPVSELTGAHLYVFGFGENRNLPELQNGS